MSDIDEFEKAFPVPVGIEFNESLGAYQAGVYSEPSVGKYNLQWETWQAARAQQSCQGREAVAKLHRYKKAYGEIYTFLGQFLDREADESHMAESDVDEAWRAFNSAPGPVFFDHIEAALQHDPESGEAAAYAIKAAYQEGFDDGMQMHRSDFDECWNGSQAKIAYDALMASRARYGR